MSVIPGTDVRLGPLLDAIAHVESSGGLNNVARYEQAWMPKGAERTVQGLLLVGTGACMSKVAMERWERFGIWTSASYSRWQILYHTAADRGYDGDPRVLWFDEAAQPFVEAQLKYLASDRCRYPARTVEDFARGWNGGNPRSMAVPSEYVERLTAAYHEAVNA